MTAGITSRPIAGTKVPFAPQAIVVLLGAMLVAGALVVAAFVSTRPAAQTTANAAQVSQALVQFRADERASWVSSTTAAQVALSLRQVRADERASEGVTTAGATSAAPRGLSLEDRDALRLEHVAGAMGSATAGPISEQDANRREHVRGPFAAPLTGGVTHPIQHGPLE